MIVNSSRVLGPWEVTPNFLRKKKCTPTQYNLTLLKVHTFSLQALHLEQVLVCNVSKIHTDINRVNGKAIILHSQLVSYKLPLTHSYNCQLCGP
jgi:uncharacterized protein YceH (UPF0502 family)